MLAFSTLGVQLTHNQPAIRFSVQPDQYQPITGHHTLGRDSLEAADQRRPEDVGQSGVFIERERRPVEFACDIFIDSVR